MRQRRKSMHTRSPRTTSSRSSSLRCDPCTFI